VHELQIRKLRLLNHKSFHLGCRQHGWRDSIVTSYIGDWLHEKSVRSLTKIMGIISKFSSVVVSTYLLLQLPFKVQLSCGKHMRELLQLHFKV